MNLLHSVIDPSSFKRPSPSIGHRKFITPTESPVVPNDITCITDIPYGGSERARLNVFRTSISVDNPHFRVPVVILIHGGAWVSADKVAATEMAVHLVRKGYCVVTPSYSLSKIRWNGIYKHITVISAIVLVFSGLSVHLFIVLFSLITLTLLRDKVYEYSIGTFSPGATHPDHIHDIAQSYRWTLDNIHTYGGEATKITLMGHSAGAHLATLLATRLELVPYGLKPFHAPRGVISISGVYSDKRMEDHPLLCPLLHSVFGIRSEYRDAFPIYNISKNTPAHLLINADVDYTLKMHTLDYAAALELMKVPCETFVAPDSTHFSIRRHWSIYHRKVLSTILIFLQRITE